MPGLFRVGVTIALLAGNIAFAVKKPLIKETAETRTRLLNRAEGRSLVDLALDQDMANRGLDCSHLVHEVLAAGGLDYPYATSFEIFAGIPQFRRVRSEQPGDLIVWPGHVGVVVSPEDRTFVSTTRTGVRTQGYDIDYWRTRGHPRFYRYLVADSSPVVLAEVSRRSTNKNTPAAFVARQSTASSLEMDSSPDDSSRIDTGDRTSAGMRISTSQRKPTKEDVEGAILELANSTTVLESDDPARSPVVLLRQVHVEQFKVKGSQGWAEVRADSRAALNPDGTWQRAAAQKLRWQLVRSEQGWTILPPSDQLYVSEKAAIPVLAKQLSVLLATRAAQSDQRPGDLAALLNVLLNEE
jgi:hypothetical protein